MNKVKVLHILSSKTYNGAENVVCQINSMLQGTEDNIELIYCSLDGPVRSHIEENKIEFSPVSKVSVKEVRRVIAEVKPNIIHAHDMKASFVASLACGKIPLISHIHNNNTDSRKISLKSILYFFAAIRAKHIFWVSNSSFNGYCFHNFVKEKSEVLVNVIDAENLYNKAVKDPNEYSYDAVYLGRLAYPKNPQRLVTIFEKVVEKDKHFTAAIVGEGEDREEVENLIQNKGLQNNVFCLGFFNNPYKILQSAKMMIMTSLWEGTPMCALEALAMGVPIVSTPVDGLCDLIENGKNGFLSDSDDELADWCFKLATDKELQKEFSEGAKRTSEAKMSIDNYRKRILSVYKEAVQ